MVGTALKIEAAEDDSSALKLAATTAENVGALIDVLVNEAGDEMIVVALFEMVDCGLAAALVEGEDEKADELDLDEEEAGVSPASSEVEETSCDDVGVSMTSADSSVCMLGCAWLEMAGGTGVTAETTCTGTAGGGAEEAAAADVAPAVFVG